ncbi:MAG TPA: BatD family protein, partial [Kofleriaceae bacterium]|nr:BatD family protein [Kofleriaceae bacterium]
PADDGGGVVGGDVNGPGSNGASGSGAPVVIQLPTDVMAPQVNASAYPTAVRLGGRFTLIITATFGDGVVVNLREPVDLGSAFEVRRKVSEDKRHSDGKTTREWQLDVTAWELGDLRIDPITVTYTVGGRAGQVETNAVRLRVDGVLGDVVDDPKAMRGLQPPTRLVSRDLFWLWVAAIAGTVVIGVIAFVMIQRRRRRRRVRLTGGFVAVPRRIDMTGERALEALLAIKASGALDDEPRRKDGYAEMVEVIRDYLGARYRISSHELTSSELLRRLARAAPAEELDLIETWLGRCDLVKYGGVRPTAAEANGVLDDARALIVTTTQLREAAAASTKEAA